DYDISYEDAAAVIAKKRKAVYDARKEAAVEKQSLIMPASKGDVQDESLFVPQDGVNLENEHDDLFEDVDIDVPAADEEDDDLQRAIAMSMEKPEDRNVLVQDDATLIDGDDEREEEGFDMQAALAESRRSKHQPKTNLRPASPKPTPGASKFSGPLPFESLNLGQSLLGKKKSKKTEEDLSGGSDRDLGDDAFRKERPPQPMPEWFNAP
ncbi:MAG: DNA repair protein rad2, partial [Watsoniomyces obsoletus]